MKKKKSKKKHLGKTVETAEELYENAPCGYVSFSADGTIFNINKTLLAWLGYSRKEIVGVKKFNSLFKLGGKIFFETHFFPLIRIQGFVKEINFDIVRKDKSTFPGLLNVNEVGSKNASSKTYRATVFDITDRKSYETELLEAKKKAEDLSEARANFLATISHEIRTPLNAILGIGDLIQRTPLNEQQKKYARILSVSSENLLDLINNLLDLSKIEANKTDLEQKAFDLSDLLEGVIGTYQIKAQEKDIHLLTDFEEDLPYHLIGDPVKINQILTNLIGNAIKFTDYGYVKLRITTKEKQDDFAVLRFQVADTGLGIPRDKLETIFSEFSQASYEVGLNYGGTGLGLTISQKLLQLYGSEMEVRSEPGKGSEFSFDIKLELNKEDQVSRNTMAPKENARRTFGLAQILVVDDNPVNIFIISEYLKAWQINFRSADSGQQALDLIQKESYDLILMDLHMPDMDGYETSKKVRELDLQKQPVIIALSASGRGDVTTKQRRAGINDYVPKPFRPMELFEALAHHLESSRTDPEKTVPVETSKESEKTTKSPGKTALGEPSTIMEHPSFDLSRFIEMAGNKPEYLGKFIKSTAKAFEDYKKDFELAARERNPQKIKELLHKSTMSIYYIKANDLTRLMEDFLELLSAEKQDDHQLRKKSKETTAAFDAVIEGMKAADASKLVQQEQ